MPQYLSAEALLGTEFHAWVEEHYRMNHDAIEEPVEGPDHRLNNLQRQFLDSEFATMRPIAIEVPFILSVAGRQIRGRLDAVFPSPDPNHDYLVVDWKTFDHPAQPVQLQHYRLAWAQTCNVPVERVQAGFYHVAAHRLDLAASLTEDEIIQHITSLGA